MVKEIRAQDWAVRFEASSLADAPYVDACLTRLGLGPFDPSTVKGVVGSNDNWSGTTADGTQVFVKRFVNMNFGIRIRRTETFYAAARDRVSVPRLIGSDPEHGLLVFQNLAGAKSGAELVGTGAFDDALCDRTGAALAAVHSLDPEGFDTSEHPFPPVADLEALPLASYLRMSMAELDMWRMLQGDEVLVQAVRELRATDMEPRPSRSPIHGDVRLDQFLLADDTLYVTDFEETRMGDPARDLGAFAGEWLYKAIAATPSTLSEASPYGHVASHEEIVATGIAELEQRTPMVQRFLRAYLDAAPARITDDKALAVRAASYAGWHMVDRLLAGSMQASQVSPVMKAAAGIGRTVLLSPAEFTESLGLEV